MFVCNPSIHQSVLVVICVLGKLREKVFLRYHVQLLVLVATHSFVRNSSLINGQRLNALLKSRNACSIDLLKLLTRCNFALEMPLLVVEILQLQM